MQVQYRKGNKVLDTFHNNDIIMYCTIAQLVAWGSAMAEANDPRVEQVFLEFRRKVRDSEMLSAATERLLLALGFSGRLSVVVQKGRVLKSG